MLTPQQQKPLPETVYISFSAEIIAHTTESLIAVLAKCANDGVTTVYLMISTPGGSVMHGDGGVRGLSPISPIS
jgi:ATP-dependent protease ClpP protease subunit